MVSGIILGSILGVIVSLLLKKMFNDEILVINATFISGYLVNLIYINIRVILLLKYF
jgi:hypothetical protein